MAELLCKLKGNFKRVHAFFSLSGSIPAVSEDAAKEALIQYAASKCCYSSAPAKEMVFRNLQPFNTYRVCSSFAAQLTHTEVSLSTNFSGSWAIHGDQTAAKRCKLPLPVQ